MGRVQLHDDGIDLSEPTLVEGLPGVGLVGKIATDHLIDAFEMDHYASVYCEGIPSVGVYHADERAVRAPVRVYADAERNLLALQSDVPVSAESAGDFASCVIGWLDAEDVTPVFLSGRPAERDESEILGEANGAPPVNGVATGDGGELLDDIDVDPPTESGAVSGPTGALLHHAAREGLTAVGLIVESDPNFPDPGAARTLLEVGLEPLVGVDVAVDVLVDRATEISKQKQQLAQRMQQATDDESSQAKPLRMYQ